MGLDFLCLNSRLCAPCSAPTLNLTFVVYLLDFLSLDTDIWSCIILDLYASLVLVETVKVEEEQADNRTSRNYCKVFIDRTITTVYFNSIEVKFNGPCYDGCSLIIAIAITTHERRRNISINHYSLPGPGPSLLLPHHLCIGDQSQVMTMEYYRNGDGGQQNIVILCCCSHIFVGQVSGTFDIDAPVIATTAGARPLVTILSSFLLLSYQLHSYLFSVC